jgi:hypothetical protein
MILHLKRLLHKLIPNRLPKHQQRRHLQKKLKLRRLQPRQKLLQRKLQRRKLQQKNKHNQKPQLKKKNQNLDQHQRKKLQRKKLHLPQKKQLLKRRQCLKR